jgi:hypothetical protein
MKLNGKWVFGYLTTDNLFIAPLVFDETLFPVGIPIYTHKDTATAQMDRDSIVGQTKPFPIGAKSMVYRLRKGGLSPFMYLSSAFNSLRNAFKITPLYGILDAAEETFMSFSIFLDPTSMKMEGTGKSNTKTKRMTDVEDVDVKAAIEWTKSQSLAKLPKTPLDT